LLQAPSLQPDIPRTGEAAVADKVFTEGVDAIDLIFVHLFAFLRILYAVLVPTRAGLIINHLQKLSPLLTMQLHHIAMRMLKRAQTDPNGTAFAFASLCNAEAMAPSLPACVKRCKSTKRNLARNMHTILAQDGKPKPKNQKAKT